LSSSFHKREIVMFPEERGEGHKAWIGKCLCPFMMCNHVHLSALEHA
jgi:hypothetical protein